MRAILTATDLADNIASFRRHLQASNLAPRTVELYVQHASALAAFLDETGMPGAVAHLTREHVEAHIADLLDRGTPANAAIHYRSLQQFFRWCVDEGEIGTSPMAKMRAPKVPEPMTPVISERHLKALLGTCKGRDFDSRRDYAVMCLLLDTGMRRGELVGIALADIDLDGRLVKVLGKGRRERKVPISGETVKALDRYLRVRREHPKADGSEALWLGRYGAMGGTGIYQMLKRRSLEAGIERVHPHQWRHTFASMWLHKGGQETDLMRLAGWRSRSMLERYGAAAADMRARDAHARMNPLSDVT